jgi:ribosomal protein L40E/predicted neutral ceramidase superfamily lipid hydrolase
MTHRKRSAVSIFVVIYCLVMLSTLGTVTLGVSSDSAANSLISLQQTITTITFPTEYITNCVETNEVTITNLCVIMSVSGHLTTLVSLSVQNPPNVGAGLNQSLLYMALVGVGIVVVLYVILNVRRRKGQPDNAPMVKAKDDKLFCISCGLENPQSNKFCGKCGKKLHQSV